MRVQFVRGLVPVALAALVGCLSACSSETEPEPVRKSESPICAGSGGGDDCVGTDGYCPASCGVCYQSLEQKLELRNKWMCDQADEGGGGAGGGGAGACWPDKAFESTITRSAIEGGIWTEAQVSEASCADARQSVESQCAASGSGWLLTCRARSVGTYAYRGPCTTENGLIKCSCRSTTTCKYDW